jgi:predicted permease
MRWTQQLRLRLRSVFLSGRVEHELGEEIQYHLEHLIDGYVAAGMSPSEARDAALREMGAIEQRKEECRDARGVALVETVKQDLMYALRGFRKSPGFTTVAILSLGLGIGANTAIFTLWNTVLHAPLPGVHKPEQLIMLSNPDESGSWTGRWDGRTDGPRSWLTYGEFEDLRDHASSFAALMASQSSLNSWQLRFEGGAWEAAAGRLVSGGFFDVLGVAPAIGRVFSVAEDRADTPAAVIGHQYWQRRFGGRPEVLGKTFTIRNAVLTIVGVAPRGFIGETSGQQPDMWLPLRMQPYVLPGKDRLHDTPPEKVMWLQVFGRLKSDISPRQAEAEANAIFQAGLQSFYGTTWSAERRREFLDQQLQLRPAARGASPRRPEFAEPLTALLIAVAVLLLIACANLANLLLARGAARTPEIALRLSLGASRGRVVRQLVTESLALAAMGGVAALAIAYVLHGALVEMLAKSDSDFHVTFALDPVVLTFLVSATIVAALLFSVLPAWHISKTDAGPWLKEQSRGAIGTRGQMRSSRMLVSVQLALSLPLLVGAGLLARTVYNLQRADLGFAAERLLLVRVDLREQGDQTRRDSLRGELLSALHRIPGVRAASFSQLGVFSGGESSATIEVEGYTARGDDDRSSARDVIGPDYFAALGIPIRRGRDILASDRGGTAAVCVINDAFARRFFHGRDPIGMQIRERSDNDEQRGCSIVGVAGSAHTQALRGDVAPRYFVTAGHAPSSLDLPTFLIRTERESALGMAAVRDAIQRVNVALPILSAASIEEQMAPLTAQDRTTAQLVVVFGCVALALAAIGLYGVLSYGIVRRTAEIAIRIALGAQRSTLISMILRETVGVVATGLVLGGALAYAASRVIDSRLYGVAPQDPLTLTLSIALLLVVAFSAAFVPARRASKLDPMGVLR